MHRKWVGQWLGLVLMVGLAPACTRNETREARQEETTVAETTPARENGARALVSRMMSEAATETELGRLAATHASNKDIRQLGSDIATDQSRLSTELTGLAARFGSVPPYTDTEKPTLVERLSALQGDEFDRAYLDALAGRYPQTLEALQQGSAARSDKTGGGGPTDRPEPTGTSGQSAGANAPAGETQVVEEWAAKAAPTLQAHLDRIETLRQRLEAKKATR